jgi:GT2 family glycosyltransferase
VVHNQEAFTRACLESLRATTTSFELCVVDNASTDGTEACIRALAPPSRLRYLRNATNAGLITALNQGARLASAEVLCFLHNDTEMREPAWLERLEGALGDGHRVGLAGLYGVRRVRRDGRYVGRTIVHSLEGGPGLREPVIEVAAVDGVCLCLRRALLDEIGGFDEGYGFFHGYDRELSFAVRERGLRCVIVDAPFVHRGGGTRTGERAPVSAAQDLEQRRQALARFSAKWRHRLPSDVRGIGERITNYFDTRGEKAKA